jgi:ketosteroid isomerase-like protein
MDTPAGSHDRTSLLNRDQQFFDALVTGDLTALSELLAEDFVLVGISDGALATRADLLAAVSSGSVTFPAITAFPGEAVVRRIGSVGIVIGRTAMNITDADGSDFVLSSRYTHVFTSDADGGWLLASAQGTQIKQATTGSDSPPGT